jgi:histidine phosphotransferase ChpT
MSDTTAILEQLASRICHDLISPIGAIGNGLELITEMGGGGMDDEAIKLIEYSSNQANAKLAAFRLCYGAGGRDPNIKPEDVQRTFAKYISGDGKVKQAWDPFGPLGIDARTPVFCKMLMLCLMQAGECLPRGGIISVDPGTAPNETIFTALGQDATLRDGVADAFATTPAATALDPRLVHPMMVGLIARTYGFTVSVRDQAEGKVVLALGYKS